MAALDLEQDITAGVERHELRKAERESPGDIQVAGALWSHPLEAEPLGLTWSDERIAFCMHRRGVYCIGFDSEEHWRIPLVNWPELAPVPDGSQIVCLVSAPPPGDVAGNECIWIWSAGGGWAIHDWENGELLDMGTLDLRERLESAWVAESGEWLLASAPERMARWIPGAEPESVHVTGPIHAAVCVAGDWSCAGWREDLLWNRSGLSREERPGIGMALLEHPDGLMLLDNIGQWSAFKS